MKTVAVRAGALLAVAASVLATCQLAAGAGARVQVIATGLNNPRGVAVAPDGSLFVVQAGVGGKRCQGSGQDAQCLGFTGSIDRIVGGERERYAAGFGSGSGRDGSFATGVDGITLGPGGTVYAIETTVGPNPNQFGPEFAAQSGHVLRVDRGVKTPIGESVGPYEFKNNPASDDRNSNPYGLAWSPIGFAVADAGANDLLLVNPSGRVTTLATFRPQKFGSYAAQSVPTSVVWHNGAFYVGELGGGGAPKGSARIWKVVPGRGPSVVATGFTTVSGLAFGPDGSMYVDELSTTGLGAFEQGKLAGALIRVWPDGHRTQVAPGRLSAPAGIAVAADGTVYVTNLSVFAGKGQLLAITP